MFDLILARGGTERYAEMRGGRGDATRVDVAPHRHVHRRDGSACGRDFKQYRLLPHRKMEARSDRGHCGRRR